MTGPGSGLRGRLPTKIILDSHYRAVIDLRSYLLAIFEEEPGNSGAEHRFLPTDSDPQPYRHLIESTYVAVNNRPETRFKYEEPYVGMDGAIKRAQQILFQAKSFKQNVLKAGYYPRKRGDGVTNTIVTGLLGLDWEILLQRAGLAIMLHLLVETSIFISLPNRCLCQMSGEPLYFIRVQTAPSTEAIGKVMKRSASHMDNPIDGTAPKRRKLGVGGRYQESRQTYTPQKPASISIVRARMFYARPNYIPKADKLVIGLPLQHVFNVDNRDGARYHHGAKVDSAPLYQEPSSKDQALKARHVLRYIFPRQHGLSNPFQLTCPSEAFGYKDYTNREDEIRRALILGIHKSTPKRLKDVLPLVDKMLWRHTKCPYRMLLNKLCPSKIKAEVNEGLDETIILEWMSERSIQIKTQNTVETSETSISFGDTSLSPNSGCPAPKPRFADFACSYVEVYRYVAIITKAVIPKAFWGSRKNFRVIMNYVKDFITGRRYETLSLHHVLQGFSTLDCSWLTPPGPGPKKQHRVSVTDALKRRELLEEFFFWFFDSFVLPLIKTSFYVTESSAFRNQVLYFRQDDWVTLCTPLVERLKSSTFEELPQSEAAEILHQRRLGFSFVRLLPKETGVRPIVNLRRKQNESGTSINKILETTFHILTYEKKNRPELTGASVWGADEIFTRLKNFKSQLKPDELGRLPRLYFVKVDVQACFDTIEQGKLLNIIKELISNESYTVRKYVQLRHAANRVQKLYSKKAYPKDKDPHFFDMAMELANALRHTIFVDQGPPSQSTKANILQLLNSHIMDNIVKIGSNYYRQTVGIPQGSVLSSLLCLFFYGDLEKQFGSYMNGQDSTLLRMIDDYLLITTNLSKAKSFLDMMNRGHDEYGCFISKEKTMTNFDYDHQITNVVDSRTRCFLWCGYAIDMKDLSVSVDYTRYHGINLSCTLTVSRGRKPGTAFVSKMLLLAKARSHVIYSDADLNSKRVIYLNIYQNFLLCAMKMHCYIRDWDARGRVRVWLIRDTVQKMINYAYISLHLQAKRNVSRSSHDNCLVKREVVLWLGYHAFHDVFSRKPTRYQIVLKWLKSELSGTRYRKYYKRYHTSIRDGMLGMREIAH